jgi:hypothetical protein
VVIHEGDCEGDLSKLEQDNPVLGETGQQAWKLEEYNMRQYSK